MTRGRRCGNGSKQVGPVLRTACSATGVCSRTNRKIDGLGRGAVLAIVGSILPLRRLNPIPIQDARDFGSGVADHRAKPPESISGRLERHAAQNWCQGVFGSGSIHTVEGDDWTGLVDGGHFWSPQRRASSLKRRQCDLAGWGGRYLVGLESDPRVCGVPVCCDSVNDRLGD